MHSTLVQSTVLNSTPPPDPGPVKLNVERVRAWFGTHEVLHGIEMPIADRSVTAIIGPSGCGKSTLIRSLNRMRGTTMAVCTHDLNMAAALCEEVVLLRDGEVLAHGRTADTITVANIRATYGVSADVHFHAEAGHLAVVPIALTS